LEDWLMFCPRSGVKNRIEANFCLSCGAQLALSPPQMPSAVATTVNSGSSAGGTVKHDYRLGRIGGAILVFLGISGGFALAEAASLIQALPNAVNIALLAAFGVATYQRRKAAVPLGWAYLALLVLMTVLHGFIPLELLQCFGLAGFMFFLRGQRLRGDNDSSELAEVLLLTLVFIGVGFVAGKFEAATAQPSSRCISREVLAQFPQPLKNGETFEQYLKRTEGIEVCP
jgi:hypothetical protein